MDTQEILAAEGVLPDVPELNKFFSMMQEADLCKHRARKSVIKEVANGIHVIIYIKAEAEALLESALATGVLAQWNNNFKIKVVALRQ